MGFATRVRAVFFVALVGTLGLAGEARAESTALREAEEAYRQLDFDRVLPLLEEARGQSPSPDEELRIIELSAIMHAIYEREQLSQAIFVQLLERLPTYQLPHDASPKILRAFQAAQREVAARRVVEGPRVTPTPPPDEGGAFYTRWWFWTAVAGVAAASVVTVVLLSEPLPEHDFGPYELP